MVDTEIGKVQKPTQCDEILMWFKIHRSISQVEALQHLGIMRLASRISDLKDRGYIFRKEMIHFRTRLNRNGCYAKYYLEGNDGIKH